MAFLDDAADDLGTAFLDDFAVDATLAGQQVRVVFDNAGEALSGLSVQQPAVQIRTADVPEPYMDKLIVIPQGAGYGNWTIREHLPDGTGMSLLLLTRVA